MHANLKLTDLETGARATVAAVCPADGHVLAETVQRLMELGFMPGEPVHLVQRGPGGREPLAVAVGESMFALRWLEAQCVEVRRA